MKGRKLYRRGRTTAGFAAILVAGLLTAGALGGSGLAFPLASSGSATDTGMSFLQVSPTISSDKDDYAPGSTVTLTGRAWAGGEAVHIFVNDDVGATWSYSSDVNADGAGDFTTQFVLPTSFVATYRVTATGPVSGTATTTFTDANVKYTPGRVPAAAFQNVFAGSTFAFTETLTKQGSGPDLTVDTPVQVADPGGTCGGSGSAIPASWLSVTSPSMPRTIGAATSLAVNMTVTPPAGTAAGTYAARANLVTTNGGGNFVLCLNVQAPASTTSNLTSSANPSTYGDSVTYTATITPTPSGAGTVDFKDGATTICSGTAVTGNQTTCTKSNLTAGTHNITAVYSGATGFNGSTSNTVAQAVNQKTVNGSFAAANKVYDGTNAASITGRSLSGSIAGDDVSLSGGTATFANKNVGNNKTVTGTGFTLAGADAGNYSLASSTLATTADITAKELIGHFTAANKVYDGTATAAILTRTLTGVVAGDTVSLVGGTASFGDKNVGSGKTVTGTGFSLSGADAGNYSLASTTLTTTADITALSVTGSFTANDKVYDGTTAATIATRSLSGAIAGDDVNLSGGTASFADKNVGNGKTVTGTGFSLSGGDAGNYSLASSTLTTTATITQKAVTGNFTAANKVYDGTAAATITATSLTGAISGDGVSLAGGLATFSDKNVGTGKTVTGSGFSLSGVDAPNYSLASSTLATTADITPRQVTGHFTADNKVYDGTTAATILTRTLTGTIGSDDVSLAGGTATFADKDVGTGKTVTGTGFSLSGGDAGNYSLDSSTLTTTANITALTITGHFTAANKVYDGTNAAAILARSLTGQIGGDAITLSGGSATFADKNVGTGKTVTGTGFSLSGADAGNYNLASSTLTTTADITPKAVAPHITAANKVYDGTTTATILSRSLTGAIAGDDVSLSGGTADFSDKNVGSGKTVVGIGFTLAGADAGNYQVSPATAATTADITPLTITGSFTAANKVYDGTNAASITGTSLNGTIVGDFVALSGGTATFSNKNVGNGKTVTGTGFFLSGADAGNYTLASSTLTTTADITPLTITGHFTAANKVYDGATAATILARTLTGTISGDDINLSGGLAGFSDKNVGNGKTVTGVGFFLSGVDTPNYTLASSTLATTADITPLTITGSFTADNKVYDGTTAASIAARSLSGAISGDDVSLSGGSATFADKHVDNGKTVTGTGFSLSGGDAGNYSLASSTLTTTADITPLAITGHFTAASKVYDATTSATILTRSLTGQIGGDDVSLVGGSATFSDKNAGNGKTVTGTGFSLSGADAGNYSLASSSVTTAADITPLTITGSFTANNKVYDGTTAATIATRSLSGPIAGDAVSLNGGSATFADKNVGNAKTVTGTGFTLSGADAGNYGLASSTLTTTADITPLTITGSFTADNRVYDATTAASIASRSLSGAISGDDVSLSGGSAAFADKNAGNGKTVTGAGFFLSGVDIGNYTLASSTLTTTADITPKQVVGHFTAANKVYDGTVAATILTRTLTGTIGGDNISLAGGLASFSDENVGTGKTVTGTGFSLSGADAGNYSLGSSTLTTTADITVKDVDGHFTAANKVYDATTAAAIVTRALTGTIAGDSISLAGGTATFADKNVGTGKTVTGTGFSLSGSDAGNYHLSSSTLTTSADITKAQLTVTADDKTMIINGSVPALTYGITGFVGGETLATSDVTGSANCTTAANGTVAGSSPISCATGSLSSGNYSFAFVAGTLTVNYAGSCQGAPIGNPILQPVNNDGSSTFKQGSTVPLKFRACDANGNSVGPTTAVPNIVASFVLDHTTAGAPGVNETVISTTPDTGFRWSATDQQWIFNLSTKNLSSNKTYTYKVTLFGGAFFYITFGLK